MQRARDRAFIMRREINTAREEAVDVLAEALWTMICTGRGPVSLDDANIKEQHETPSRRPRSKRSQFIENTRD